MDTKLKKPSHLLFETADHFSKYIEILAHENDATLTQTLIDWVEMNDPSDQFLRKFIAQSLKDKLEQEFVNSGLLKKTSFSLT